MEQGTVGCMEGGHAVVALLLTTFIFILVGGLASTHTLWGYDGGCLGHGDGRPCGHLPGAPGQRQDGVPPAR